jgi:hypothetical protein
MSYTWVSDNIVLNGKVPHTTHERAICDLYRRTRAFYVILKLGETEECRVMNGACDNDSSSCDIPYHITILQSESTSCSTVRALF